jgi:hypothetical protein
MAGKEFGERLHQVTKKTGQAIHRGAAIPTDVEFIDTFIEHGINTFPMVADSIFSSSDQYLMDRAAGGDVNRWVLPSERSIPAVATGRWLATGEISAMVMQNTGFSNAMEYLRSVMLVHKIPGVVISTWRGYDPDLDDSEPHILVGDVTDMDNKNTVGRNHVFGKRSGIGLIRDTERAIQDAKDGNLSCIRVSPPGLKKSYELRQVRDDQIRYLDMDYYEDIKAKKGRPFREVQKDPLRSRDEALRDIHDIMKDKDPFYIVGNGYNPRAMQGLRLSRYTFENAGGMGSSLAIAWGAAKSNPEQTYVAVEGDQNDVMNEMEKVLSSDFPNNLYWFVLNNGSGESVGTALSLPLSPWHYELAHVINTRNEKPGSFKYDRINATGLKFDNREAIELARRIGNLPAEAHMARKLLAEKQELRDEAKREDSWTASNMIKEGRIPQIRTTNP